MGRAEDTALTQRALAKIVSAQSRGTLSPNLHIRRLPTQIVVENTVETDRAWLCKNFPGGTYENGGMVDRRTGSKQCFETQRYVARLREQIEYKHLADYPPRLEVWGIKVPHVCTSFTGNVSEAGVVTWKCAAYRCAKRITKTKARALGLIA